MARLKSILFVVNQTKPGGESLASELKGIAESFQARAEIYTAYPIRKALLKDVDLCVVVGGDGTLLSVVEEASHWHTPVLGVNLGRLGFIAGFTPADIRQQFPEIISGEFSSRKLSVLSCQADGFDPVHALNDIVVKARSSRLIRLEVYCEEEHMNTYHADGVIFSTPTGSTAYNLSAGGPIVHPTAGVMVVTPINPHTLSNRAIVLNNDHVLSMKVIGDTQDVQISADGVEKKDIVLEFPIQIRIPPDRSFPLVQPKDYSHYFVLRNKLRWTGDAIFRQDPD